MAIYPRWDQLGEATQDYVLEQIAEMSMLQGDDGTTLDDLMVSCLGHIFGSIENSTKEQPESESENDDTSDSEHAKPVGKTKKKAVDSKRIAIKATEDKILGQWRFTVLSSPKVMAIQAQRDKNLADDLIAKATKKQAQIENAARAQEAAKQKESISIAVHESSSTVAVAGAPCRPQGSVL